MPKRSARRSKRKAPKRLPTRYLFVFGGVLSGVGKGTAVSSIGRILMSKGFRVTAMKIDPYLNIDAGTMNPTEHGEVFVTGDGLEADQDLGNYERFLGIDMGRVNYMTSGQVYQTVLNQERNLFYKGQCVETVPHIPEEVIRRIERLSKESKAEIVLIEVGGTVGEYQNLVFLEAARMMKLKRPGQVQFLMVSYLPIPSKIGEMKTKPTQHAVQQLNAAGIQPDFLLCRARVPLDDKRREKLSMFCNVRAENVISAPDVDSIYDIPVNLNREHIAERILAGFGMTVRQHDMREWKQYAAKIRNLKKTVRIGIIGKYFSTGSFVLSDSYISVIEAIKHAAWGARIKPEIEWLNAEEMTTPKETAERLQNFDGIVVPGGFGSRASEGKLAAIQYARKHNKPFFGLCFGMQHAVIEVARNVLRLKDANSTEINEATKHPVICVMESQKETLTNSQYGGTMRLGNYRCVLRNNTKTKEAYGARAVDERHRHRYEMNPDYKERLEKAGLMVSGTNPDTGLAEIVELKDHPFFIGTQFHPEFRSRPMQPHPLFSAFIQAAINESKH